MQLPGPDVQPSGLLLQADPGVHIVPPLHELWPLHVTSHAHAVPQRTCCAHAPAPEHVTLHAPVPHVMMPPHVLPALHVTLQRVAALQSIACAQAPTALHWTSHAIPAGHMTGVEQAPAVLQAKRHVVVFTHVPPASVHAAVHVGCGVPITQ